MGRRKERNRRREEKVAVSLLRKEERGNVERKGEKQWEKGKEYKTREGRLVAVYRASIC